ncbi:hypothetical protein Tco_1181748 [Tanacetum coccineum]
MMEMFSLLKEYTKGKFPEKVLVREEVSRPVTKYVNDISLLRMENKKGKDDNEFVDKNIIEPIEIVEKKEAIDDEKDNQSDKSMNESSTRWGKYVDRLIEMPRSVVILDEKSPEVLWIFTWTILG